MAKFCQNCGSPLGEGVRFCTSCGSPVPQTAQPQQPKSSPNPQPHSYTPRPQVRIPEQFAQRNAARAQQNAAPVKKEKGKGGLIAVVSLVLVAAIVLGVFGFRDGGWFRGSGKQTAAYDGKSGYGARESTEGYMQSEHEALLDYAKRLEEAGNEEAAAAVYALLPQGGGAELIEKAHDEFPVLSAADELGQFEAVFSHLKGGDGK